jgi:hypothetical protein
LGEGGREAPFRLLNIASSVNLRWLIGRIYPDTLGSDPDNEPKKVRQTILRVPEEILEEARAEFKRRCRENDWD